MNNHQNLSSTSESEGITFETKHTHFHPLKLMKVISLNLAFLLFFVFATLQFIRKSESCEFNCEFNFCSPYILLVLITVAVYLGIIYSVLKKYFWECLSERLIDPVTFVLARVFKSSFSKFILSMAILLSLGVLMVFETRDDYYRLQSVTGIISFTLIGYVFSYNKYAVNWRPVLCGFTFQFLLGVFCIRWQIGRIFFRCLSGKIAEFLQFSQFGSSFVFGEFLVHEKFTFAFAALPTIFFFSFCISVLYYLGIMQWFLKSLGSILQSILGTTVCESINAAGNIFLGQSESPLLIRPYIKHLTHSEIHSIMVSGFSTVSGTVLAAYIAFGANAYHLITASVMAAPASLFFSKLFYPETEQSLTTSGNIQLERSSDSSLLDAASNGAQNGIRLYLNIIANLIGFVAFLAFTDSMIQWATFLLGFDDVGIEFILGKMFIPFSWALGVEWKDCEAVGNVIGTKTIINEFVAYRLLGEYEKAGEITHRSTAIATFAICGFANPSSMGIMIGALSAMAPERRPSITKVAFRAFISGCLVSLITASIAGLLMTDEMIAATIQHEQISNRTSIFL